MAEPTPRIDQWLWSVRITKTRADAAELCRSGHVKVNGKTVKPSAKVAVGDRIETRVHQLDRILVVTSLISKRVGAAIATECFEDHSPPPPERHVESPVFARERGAGRPTKRDRRRLDELRGRGRRPTR
jgi:ribosome-associated heat shock protein Hsp15